ncbi:hypothetical protein GHK33_04510 [Sinorhizobium meliloti]|nr:hypothetical protein [Sinorhizobium medicae]MQW61961.1 hypothetical protein [Sinorhizobium meliloti]MQX91424.1 hypothetical protein [Sinorhizobium meliloti]
MQKLNDDTTTSVTIRRETGPTMLLGSGNYFDYANPEAEDLTIEDYAYGLAFTGRFSGQCVNKRTGQRVFYSVAQHCEILSKLVPAELAYAALMHESGEVVCGDLTSPLKSMLPSYKTIEKACAAAIERRFRVPAEDVAAIKPYDIRLWASEREQLLNWDGRPWGASDNALPFDVLIEPKDPYTAAKDFLNRFSELAPFETAAP